MIRRRKRKYDDPLLHPDHPRPRTRREFLGQPGRRHHRFLKLGFRGAQIIAVVNLAVSLRLFQGRVREARIAFGAVAPTVVRAPHAEQALRDSALEPEVIARAAEAALDDISPIDDHRATAAYRRRVARNFVRLALEEVAAREAQEG